MVYLRYIALILAVLLPLGPGRTALAADRDNTRRVETRPVGKSSKDAKGRPRISLVRKYGLPAVGLGIAGGGFGVASALHMGTLYGFATQQMTFGAFAAALFSTATTVHLVAIGAAAVGAVGIGVALTSFALGLRGNKKETVASQKKETVAPQVAPQMRDDDLLAEHPSNPLYQQGTVTPTADELKALVAQGLLAQEALAGGSQGLPASQ